MLGELLRCIELAKVTVSSQVLDQPHMIHVQQFESMNILNCLQSFTTRSSLSDWVYSIDCTWGGGGRMCRNAPCLTASHGTAGGRLRCSLAPLEHISWCLAISHTHIYCRHSHTCTRHKGTPFLHLDTLPLFSLHPDTLTDFAYLNIISYLFTMSHTPILYCRQTHTHTSRKDTFFLQPDTLPHLSLYPSTPYTVHTQIYISHHPFFYKLYIYPSTHPHTVLLHLHFPLHA